MFHPFSLFIYYDFITSARDDAGHFVFGAKNNESRNRSTLVVKSKTPNSPLGSLLFTVSEMKLSFV